MELNPHLKKRFCKDEHLGITVFEEPYFSQRIELYGKTKALNAYKKMIEEKFDSNGDAFLEYYNQVTENMIEYIKESETYQNFNQLDMNEVMKKVYPLKHIPKNITKTDAYNVGNIGQYFISIDMAKANFTALTEYGLRTNVPFTDNKDPYDYESFIRKFTDIDHIIKSKHIREVVFGNCNPPRQITYESILMKKFCDELIDSGAIALDDVYSISADEILLIENDMEMRNAVFTAVSKFTRERFPVKVEFFRLGKFNGSKAFVKEISDVNGMLLEYKPKCVSSDEMPAIYRYLSSQDITDDDMVFMHDHKLARFLDKPIIDMTFGDNHED